MANSRATRVAYSLAGLNHASGDEYTHVHSAANLNRATHHDARAHRDVSAYRDIHSNAGADGNAIAIVIVIVMGESALAGLLAYPLHGHLCEPSFRRTTDGGYARDKDGPVRFTHLSEEGAPRHG